MPGPERRSESFAFDYVLIGLLLLLFAALLHSMTADQVKPEVLTPIAASLGVIVGYVGSVVQYRWGSVKKAEPPPPPAFQATVTKTETVASTEPAPAQPGAAP